MEESTARTAHLYVPINLDLSIYPLKYRGPIAYLLDLIHRKTCSWQADEHGFVRLKSEYLTKVIPPRLWNGLLRDYLESGGGVIPGTDERYPTVVQTDAYDQGIKCRGYKLVDEYRSMGLSKCEDPKFITKLKRVKKEDDKRLLPVHLHLREQFKRLEFDLPRALKIINTLVPEEEVGRWRWIDGKLKRCQPLSIDDFRGILIGQAQRLADGIPFFEPDEYGRVHTPIVSLPKELRCCLSIRTESGQEPIVWLDARNSQPLIAVMLAMVWYSSSEMSRSRIRNQKFSKDRNPYESTNKRIAAASLCFSLSSPTPNPLQPSSYYVDTFVVEPNKTRGFRRSLPVSILPDVVEDRNRCEDGQFYETYMEKEMTDAERSKFKVQMFREVFFGSNSVKSKIKSKFAKISPSVSRVLYDLKRNDKERSAWLLQNYEATIFIFRICNRIRKEFEHIPIFTIHDCIGTTVEHLPCIEEIIKEEFAKLGVIPSLKKETPNDPTGD